MHHYQRVVICLVVLSGCNLAAIPTVAAVINAQPSNTMVQVNKQHRYLRTLKKAADPFASTKSVDVDETIQDGAFSRQDQEVHEVEDGTSTVDSFQYNTGYNNDGYPTYYNDDIYNLYVETCDGFRYELDENGICQVSTGYIVLVTFINIAIVIAIVVASCACCKCCVWYPYLCCASGGEIRPNHKTAGRSVTAAAYPVNSATQHSNPHSSAVETATTSTVPKDMQDNGITATPEANSNGTTLEC